MKYSLALLLLVCNFCFGQSLYLGGVSVHAPSADATNNTHNFLAVEYNNYIVGKYVNSYGFDTQFVAKRIPLPAFNFGPYFEVYGNIGITHGYRTCAFSTHESKDARYCGSAAIEVDYIASQIRPSILFFGNGLAVLIKIKF